MTTKTALVAGGAGFVGSHLAELLLNHKYHVTVVDCLVTGQQRNLESFRKNSHFEFVEADISKPLPEAITGRRFDEIYNLASPASPIDFDRLPVFILMTAAIGHRQLLDLGRKWKVPVLFASSSEVYGDAEVHPQVETYFGNVNTTGHRSCYDEAKRFGEALSAAYAREFGVETRIARIFNTYGARMRADDGRIIPNFFTQALQGQPLTVYGDGKQTRSFCYVTDLVKGIYALMQSQESRPVNLGNPIERTVLEMAETINALTGNKAGLVYRPLPENDPKQRRPNISRATNGFGWKPEVSLEEGLAKSHSYFVEELKHNPKLRARVLT